MRRLPHPDLLAALDAAFHEARPGSVQLPAPPVTVGCAPIRDGVLLHLTAADASGAERARTTALQRLTGALSGAATPSAIARLVVDERGRSCSARTGPGCSPGPARRSTALHRTGWGTEVCPPFDRIPVQRGRPLSDAVLDRGPRSGWRTPSSGGSATRTWPRWARPAGSRPPRACRCASRTATWAHWCSASCVPRAFSADEREYLMAVAALCAQALDRARLLVAERDARARRRAPARPDDLPRRRPARLHGGAAVGRAAAAPARRPGRAGRRRLVRGAPRARRPGRPGGGGAQRPGRRSRSWPACRSATRPIPDAAGGAIQVSRTGGPALFPEIPDELLVAGAVDDEHLALIRSIGLRSAVVVPLLVRGRSLGALTLVQAESGQRFDEADVAFAEQLAANAAIALDNARLYEEQVAHRAHAAGRAAARPPSRPSPACASPPATARSPPTNPGIQVGGDLYDVVAGSARALGVVVADVCGKGAARRGADGADPAHDARRDRPRARAGRGAATGSTARCCAGRPAAPAGSRRSSTPEVTVDADGRDRAAGQRGPPPPLVRRGDRVEAVSAPGTVLGVYAGRRADRGDLPAGPRRHDGALHRRCDGGARRGRLLRAAAADRVARRRHRGPADDVAAALLADVVALPAGRLRDDVAILVLEATP